MLGAQDSEVYEKNITFHNFPWGTSMNDFISKMGQPVSRDKNNGLDSLVWRNVDINGYTTYMIAYFCRLGLQGGTYYFVTHNLEEDIKCYSEMREELRNKFGPTRLFDGGIMRELRPYVCSWTFPTGYVQLKVNTRYEEPVTLWYSSPELTKQFFD